MIEPEAQKPPELTAKTPDSFLLDLGDISQGHKEGARFESKKEDGGGAPPSDLIFSDFSVPATVSSPANVINVDSLLDISGT